MIDLIQLLEYSGCLLGIIGGALNCSADIHKKIWAFRTWFVSNMVLAYWGFLTGNWGQVAMYTFFLGTSYYGILVHKE